MTPEIALERQLEAYRRMTGEERLAIGLRLHELSCEVAREGIRHQHPQATVEEVERLLHKRLKLARELGHMTENDLLQDCLQRLNACGIPYMLTGSMASNYWGVPRSTHDLDFVVRLRAEDVAPLVKVLEGDYFIQESSVRSGLEPPYQFNALDNRSALKIDFWVLTKEPFAQEMFNRRQQVTLFGTPALIASAEDVILHKLLWHTLMPSDRQLRDAAGVWALQEEKLDLDYMRKWASELKVEELLDQLKRGEIRPKSS